MLCVIPTRGVLLGTSKDSFEIFKGVFSLYLTLFISAHPRNFVQETILSGTKGVQKVIWYRRRSSAVPNGFGKVFGTGDRA